MTDELLVLVREVTGARGAERVERIQELWSGYGELVRVRLDGAERATVVVKWARPPGRGGESRISHARKCRSYDAETAFYRNLAPRCDDRCRVARLLGARTGGEQWILVLEDLDAAGFARRVRGPRGDDRSACLRWLATFHARFLGESPEGAGVWPVGTYWHLGTRQEELRWRRGAIRR